METEFIDLDKVKLFNIVDMGLSFSAMIRLYEKESKKIIRDNILKILAFERISINVLIFFIIWMYQPLLQKLNIPIIYFGLVSSLMSGSQIPIMNSFDKLKKYSVQKDDFYYSALFCRASALYYSV